MSWELFLVINVVALSISVLLQRVLLHDDKSDPIAYAIVFQSLVAVSVSIYAFVNGFQLPDISKYWLPILLAFLLYGAGNVIYAKTLQRVEASIFTILFATNAIWVMIASYIFFDEHLEVTQIIGASLIFASVVLLAERKGTFRLDKGILMGLLTGLIFGVATVVWIYVGKYSDAASWVALSFAGPALVILLSNPHAVTKMKPFLQREILLRISLLGVIFAIAAVALQTSYQKGSASIIAPLQQTSIILTILLAVVLLRERKYLWQKITAASLCFLGVVLIV